jgi:type II secretory pathway pseudopilin PulG
MLKMTRIIHIARRANQDQVGLSLIELMVAISVLFIALLVLARTATVAFSDVAVARQRQTGAQLANRLLEEVRGLPYASVQKGLSGLDLGGDPENIHLCGGTYYYPACDAEPLVYTPGLPLDPPTTPLIPHQGAVGPPDFPSEYTWSVYVTEATDAPEQGAYRVTARVSWTAAVRQGLRNFVEVQTLIYSPEGCVSTDTHPFSAPCQSYFYGNGNSGSGASQTTGSIAGISFDAAGFGLLEQASDAQEEQVTHVEGAVVLPSAWTLVGETKTETTPAGVVTDADNDPSSPSGTYDSGSSGLQAPGTASVSGGGNQLSVSIAGSASGSSVSATAASPSNSCNLQTDGRPCGYSSATQVGAMAQTLSLSSGVGSASLISIAALTTPNTTYVRRFVPAGGEPGLIRETVTWRLPQISIGGLPSGQVQAPSGWAGYWVRLSGFTATATAEAGLNTAAPTVTISGGQISYWNGSGYSSRSVTASAEEIPIRAVDHSAGLGDGNIVRVQISGAVNVQQSTTAQSLDGTSTRLEARAAVGAPLVVELNYTVSRNGQQMADLAMEFNAGDARANTVYQPAPTA